MKKFLTPKNIVIAVIVLLVLAVGIYFLWEPVAYLFADKENLDKFIKSLGVWGPLAVILLQFVQVVLAPIPGQFTSLASGFLFGWWGLLLTIVGSTLGFVAVTALSRKFGRPLLEKFFKKDQIKKFDFVTERGIFVLFLIYLLPAFPDDLVSYLAGLTKVRFRNLVVIAVVGRFPGYLVLNMVGSGASKSNAGLVFGLAAFTIAIFALAFWKRAWLEELIKSDHKLEFVKKSFKKTKKRKK
jgi:uncharacterized membrane protein YdjX (TVP38/TMEM64 family)